MDTTESEEKIVWSNGMIAIVEKHKLKTIEVPITEIYVEDGSTLNPWMHGFGNLGTIIAWLLKRDLCPSSALSERCSRLLD